MRYCGNFPARVRPDGAVSDLEQARDCVRIAQDDMNRVLGRGERVDLLLDNFDCTMETARSLVASMHVGRIV